MNSALPRAQGEERERNFFSKDDTESLRAQRRGPLTREKRPPQRQSFNELLPPPPTHANQMGGLTRRRGPDQTWPPRFLYTGELVGVRGVGLGGGGDTSDACQAGVGMALCILGGTEAPLSWAATGRESVGGL